MTKGIENTQIVIFMRLYTNENIVIINILLRFCNYIALKVKNCISKDVTVFTFSLLHRFFFLPF